MDQNQITDQIRKEFGDDLFAHFMTTNHQMFPLSDEFSVKIVDQLWLNYRINYPAEGFGPISKEALERLEDVELDPELVEKCKIIFDQFVKGQKKLLVVATGIPSHGCYLIWKRGRDFLIITEQDGITESISEVIKLKNLEVSPILAYII